MENINFRNNRNFTLQKLIQLTKCPIQRTCKSTWMITCLKEEYLKKSKLGFKECAVCLSEMLFFRRGVLGNWEFYCYYKSNILQSAMSLSVQDKI